MIKRMDRQRITRPNAQILDEASTWFVEFSEGEVGREAREEFNRWLRVSPEHVRAYLQLSALWEDAPFLKEPGTVDVDELIARARADRNVVHARVRLPERVRRLRLSSWGRWGSGQRALVAANLTVLIAFLTAVALWLNSETGLYSTGIGEQRSVTLADGSTIELNAQSRVRVSLKAHERDVELVDGQALFEVAKDASRPFIVTSGAARVRAVGTQFDVLKGSSETVVTVLEGRVAVTGWWSPTTTLVNSAGSASPSDSGGGFGATGELVSAGEQLTLAAQAATDTVTSTPTRSEAEPRPRPKRVDVAAATAWRQRKLVFSSSPLTEVIEAYNRYHEKRLVLRDRELADFHVSGVFSATDSAALIAFLRDQHSIDVRETDRGFEVVSRK